MESPIASQFHRRSDWPAFEHAAPGVIAALRMLGNAVDDSGLDKSLTELLKVRASQINGCAFCLQFHLNLARKLGLAPAKIDLVATWREAGVFSARERAALAWTEAVTRVADSHVPDAAWETMRPHFTPEEAVDLTLAISAINAWNRFAVAFRKLPA
jgi:AhpD family alkylhydroperoxidase